MIGVKLRYSSRVSFSVWHTEVVSSIRSSPIYIDSRRNSFLYANVIMYVDKKKKKKILSSVELRNLEY